MSGVNAVTRRGLLGSAAMGAAAFGVGCSRTNQPADVSGPRNNPLDGIGRENLKITGVRVRLFACDVPPEEWWYGAGVTILTEVETDQGIIGIGGPSPYGEPDFVKQYTETGIKPCVLGKNPFDLDVFAPSHTETKRAMAWAGINVACWDIIGKTKNKPVYELLATNCEPRTSIEHYASAGAIYNFDKRPEDLLTTRFEFQDWINRDAYGIVQPDCDTTGLSEGWYIAQHAHLHDKPCIPHNWHGGLTWVSNIQLAAAIPNRQVLESERHYNPFRGGLFKEPVIVKNSFAEVPKGPGLGVEINGAEKKFPYNPNKHWLKWQPKA